MAYADQQPMSTNRMIAIILVVLLHAGIGFALVSGLAYEAIKKVKEKMEVIDVKEEKPPEDEPPPPPPEEVIITPPPSFALELNVKNDNKSELAKQDDTKKEEIKESYKPCPDGSRVLESATCAQKDEDYTCPDGKTVVKNSQRSSCPKVEDKSRPAKPKNNPGSWATTNDYPSRALSQEREGTTTFRVTVGADGKVADCSVTGSSGHGDLDAATCSNVKRRARFDPALSKDGSPTTGSYSNRVTWRIPKE
jgi:periplasmic protein TonB